MPDEKDQSRGSPESGNISEDKTEGNPTYADVEAHKPESTVQQDSKISYVEDQEEDSDSDKFNIIGDTHIYTKDIKEKQVESNIGKSRSLAGSGFNSQFGEPSRLPPPLVSRE